jgi:hypothetical protein
MISGPYRGDEQGRDIPGPVATDGCRFGNEQLRLTLEPIADLAVPELGGYIQGVQFFAGLESHGFAGRDADLGTGAGVAPDSGFAWAHAKNAKTAQFDAVSCSEGEFESFKDGVYSRFSLGPRQASALDHVMNDILLDQCRRPLTWRILPQYATAHWRDAIESWRRCQSWRTPIP